jgi:hypothetical protein
MEQFQQFYDKVCWAGLGHAGCGLLAACSARVTVGLDVCQYFPSVNIANMNLVDALDGKWRRRVVGPARAGSPLQKLDVCGAGMQFLPLEKCSYLRAHSFINLVETVFP